MSQPCCPARRSTSPTLPRSCGRSSTTSGPAARGCPRRHPAIRRRRARRPPRTARGHRQGRGRPRRAAARTACGARGGIRRCRVVHEAQRLPEHTTRLAPGATVTERYVPVGRVGLYVPGGLVAYPSSVVMNVVPAQVAGVRSIAVMSRRRRTAACRTPPSSARARCSASTRSTPSAAPRRSRWSRRAPRTVRRSTSSPDRATSTSPRPSGW